MLSPPCDISGKPVSPVALITGGEGDLAQAVAGELRSAGWTVHAPGRRELDVASAPAVEEYFLRFERLDLLVNNAAVRADRSMATLSEDDWDRVLDTGLRGAWLCARAAARMMTAQGRGHIIGIGSFSALSGVAGQAAYSAAKAGLIGLTHSLARELGPHQVRVNCVLPGWMDTKFTTGVPEPVRRRALDQHVLGRFNTPVEAARFILALHGMEAVSGQVFQLDSRISPW